MSTILMIIFLVVVAFVIYIIWLNTTSAGKKKLKEMEAVKLKNKEFIANYLSLGKYLHGHAHIDKPVNSVFCRKEENFLYFFDYTIPKEEYLKVPDPLELAKIPLSAIKNINIEDASTMEKKVTIGRVFLVGIFAFTDTLKKKQLNEISYLTIDWNDGKFDHETIFEFVGKDALQRCNIAKNQLIRWCQE